MISAMHSSNSSSPIISPSRVRLQQRTKYARGGARWFMSALVLTACGGSGGGSAAMAQPDVGVMSRRAPLVGKAAGVKFDDMASWHGAECLLMDDDWRTNPFTPAVWEDWSMRQFAAYLIVTCPEDRWVDAAEAMVVVKGWAEEPARDLVADMTAAALTAEG